MQILPNFDQLSCAAAGEGFTLPGFCDILMKEKQETGCGKEEWT